MLSGITDGGLDPLSWVGVAVVIMSIIGYTYLMHQFKQQQQQAMADASDLTGAGGDKDAPLASKDGGGAKPDEKTPLAGSKV